MLFGRILCTVPGLYQMKAKKENQKRARNESWRNYTYFRESRAAIAIRRAHHDRQRKRKEKVNAAPTHNT